MSIKIIDIFWDRMYLNIILQGQDIKDNIYLASNTQKIKLELNEIRKDKYKSIINITNTDGIMLKNDDYQFKVKTRDKLDLIEISSEVGYKLESLDKVYRYSGKNFAYTISFEPQKVNGKITCLLISRFMAINKKYYKEQIKSSKKPVKGALKVFAENCMNIFYKICSAIHYNKKKNILLMSETRVPISGNLKALDDRMKERNVNKQYKISYSFFKTLELSKINLMLKYLKLIWIVSKQKIIFIDDYSPIFKFISLSKKTKLIQLWHAGVGFKSVGYSRFGFSGPHPYLSCHRKYNYAVVGAEALVPVYEEVFGIKKEKILPYGLPRLDDFLDEKKIEIAKEKIYSKYPKLQKKHIILFAPTFRGRGQRDAYYPYQNLNLKEIFDLCKKENYIFLIKMHPFIRKKIEIPDEYKESILDLSNYPDINELFYITDILITDYSSNIYDFSLLNKPIIFYTFDLDEYQIINKVHRAIKEYAPGKICMKFENVIKSIYEKDFEIEKLNKFREENFSIHNSKASDLIIDNIILKNNNND